MFTEAQVQQGGEARRAALEGRVQRSSGLLESIPGDVARSQTFAAQTRAEQVEQDGKAFTRFVGTASSYNHRYQVWDMFGPYSEKVAPGAGAKSLSSGPDAVYLINHKGLSLARTTNGTLTLTETADGLEYVALCNPKRSDVADLALAVEDRTVTECSFAFRITDGEWSPDYTEYTITGYDIDRGDVSACTYGANPATSVEARSLALRALETLDGGALRAVHEALGARLAAERALIGAAPAASGPSVALMRQLLDAGRL